MERNEALLRKVGDVIAAEPESYSQHEWFDWGSGCGTTACVAGHAVMAHPDFEEIVAVPERTISGWARLGGIARPVDHHAADLLGLASSDAMVLFAPDWQPAGDPSVPLHERVQAALYALADGASVEEVTR